VHRNLRLSTSVALVSLDESLHHWTLLIPHQRKKEQARSS